VVSFFQILRVEATPQPRGPRPRREHQSTSHWPTSITHRIPTRIPRDARAPGTDLWPPLPASPPAGRTQHSTRDPPRVHGHSTPDLPPLRRILRAVPQHPLPFADSTGHRAFLHHQPRHTRGTAARARA
jgi:hypothetical protein